MPVQAKARQAWISAVCLAGLLTACSRPPKPGTYSWDPKAAAAYLDQREVTWMQWPGAARDHGTFCVSCHTVVPYILSRPALRKVLAEPAPSDTERRIIENVAKRVQLWNEVEPYYPDAYKPGGTATSRGTEAVLNALILANYDTESGHLSEITRAALNNMWSLQLKEGDGKGSWSWLTFGMEPFEAKDSQYYGAALAAVATGIAPDNYRASAGIQDNLRLLRDYLNRELARQSTMNRVVLLWASTTLPGLLDSKEQKAIVTEVLDQQQADGGWKLSSTAWPDDWSLHSIIRRRIREDWSRQDTRTDGYATGLITFVLQAAGLSKQDPNVQRGLTWLACNQGKEEGSWYSYSLSNRRNPSSNVGHFMRDAATAYAVLALSEGGVPTSSQHASTESHSSPK